MDRLSEEIIDIYERRARDFDADRSRKLFEKTWLDRLLALLPARPSILDIGCGCGEPIARYLIDQGAHVTGIDSSAAMITMCRNRFPHQEWHVSDMRILSLGKTFDGLIAWDSFFHLKHDDQRRMFHIFAAHAKPSAALMFTSGTSHGEAFGALREETLYHASLAPEEYRASLETIGFHVAHHQPEDKACTGHTIWLARKQ